MREALASRGETGSADPPNPDRAAGLTRAMHDAAQQRVAGPTWGEQAIEEHRRAAQPEPFEKIEQLPSGLTCPGCYAATGIAQPHDPRVTPATPWVKDAAFPGCEVQREGPEVVGVRSPNWATKKEDDR